MRPYEMYFVMTHDIPYYRQDASDFRGTPWGARIIALLDNRPRSWLTKVTGISASTLSDIISKNVPGADKALAIAQALGTTVEYLMTGQAGDAALPAEMLSLPLVEGLGPGPAEGQPVAARIILPRAHLARIPGIRSEPWLVEMPTPIMGDLCAQGDLAICQGADTAFPERAVYIFELGGIPAIRRVRRSAEGIDLVADHPAEAPIRAFADGPGGAGHTLRILARVVGAIRIAPAN